MSILEKAAAAYERRRAELEAESQGTNNPKEITVTMQKSGPGCLGVLVMLAFLGIVALFVPFGPFLAPALFVVWIFLLLIK